MLHFPLLAVLGSALSVGVGAATLKVPPVKAPPTSTSSPAHGTAHTPKTATLTRVAVQTPAATKIVPKVSADGALAPAAAQAASLPFGTNCCGWGGVFGWTAAAGSSVAHMGGDCLDSQTGQLVVSPTLDVNSCVGWDPATGEIGCANTGLAVAGHSFISAQSGCRVVGGPSVLGVLTNTPTSTLMWAVCNGPQANELVVIELDLDLCVGINTSGQLACY